MVPAVLVPLPPKSCPAPPQVLTPQPPVEVWTMAATAAVVPRLPIVTRCPFRALVLLVGLHHASTVQVPCPVGQVPDEGKAIEPLLNDMAVSAESAASVRSPIALCVT